MQLTKGQLEILRELAARLRREVGAVDVRLFGSAARGELRPDSDIDLFVVVPRADWETFHQISGICSDAPDGLGHLVCPSVFQTDEVAAKVTIQPILPEILTEGIAL